MPSFTIEISDKTLTGLKKVVADYNANTGQALTVQAWLLLHIKEAAIAQQLATAAAAIVEQHQRDAQATLEAAVTTARDELVASLG